MGDGQLRGVMARCSVLVHADVIFRAQYPLERMLGNVVLARCPLHPLDEVRQHIYLDVLDHVIEDLIDANLLFGERGAFSVYLAALGRNQPAHFAAIELGGSLVAFLTDTKHSLVIA